MKPIEVCAAVVVRGGRILLATRRPGGDMAGLWEFPGGKIAAGEAPEQCIARELQEELGIVLTGSSRRWEMEYDYPQRRIHFHFMYCQIADGAVAVPQEGQECGWFMPSEIAALELAPADREFFNRNQADLRRLAAGALPEWLKTSFSGGRERIEMRRMLRGAGLHTVCEGAKCPNRCECWKQRTATFMILGDTCTRACRFCSVNHGRPLPPDPDEPVKIADSVEKLGLKYAVVTCVTRDDLPDGGAGMMAEVITAVKERMPGTLVEVLVSDYNGDFAAADAVLAAEPAVFGHNLETVERLSPSIRSRADYHRSLSVLAHAAANRRPGTVVKSGMMLGLGERDEEIRAALRDLRAAGVDIVTLGQYLQPTGLQVPVARFVTPEEFQAWSEFAEKELGFSRAVCGPLVRSSYMAAEAYHQALAGRAH